MSLPANEPRLSKAELGARIRRERNRQSMTLAELSRRSGVSLASLSKAERGQNALSYDKFLAVSQALHLDLSELFGRPEAPSPRNIVVDRAGQGVHYVANRYHYGMLATAWPNKRMTPMQGRVEPGEPIDAADFSQHAGEEFIFVLRGVLTMQFADGRSETLHAHDSIYFDSSLGHHYLCASAEPVDILVVCLDAVPARSSGDRA